MTEEKATLVMVLPLRGIGYLLARGEKRKELENGYTVVDSKSLPELERFDKKYVTKVVAESDWSHISNTPVFLQTSCELAIGNDIRGVEEKASELCGEKIDRFLIALNIMEKLWSFRPDVRLSWFKKDLPLSWQNISIRHYHPLSLFEKKPPLKDFQVAAQLTEKIDAVYSGANRDGEDYPALRTAFSAVKLGMYAFNASMRFSLSARGHRIGEFVLD